VTKVHQQPAASNQQPAASSQQPVKAEKSQLRLLTDDMEN
jgi:hypothetical protein